MPDGEFYDLRGLPSWSQYAIASRSLLAALQIDDPEKTLFVQLTVSELSLLTFSMLVMSRIFPEFQVIAEDLSVKVTQVSDAQNFLTKGEE